MAPSPALFSPTYGPLKEADRALHFAFIGEDLVLGESGDFPPSGNEAMAALGPCTEALTFGQLGDRPCVLQLWPSTPELPAGLIKADYRRLWGQWTAGQLEAVARAKQLAVWRQQNNFCGACGQAMQTLADEPARECQACQHRAYPRISPVCIGLVVKGEEILLARSPHFPPGIYSALAGFVEAGESVEQCLRREIREEAGIEIGNIRWFGSQSWPYPHSLMMGFFADYAGGELCPQAGEIEDLRWFEIDRLPALPHPSTIAFQMIQGFLQTR